MRPVRKRSEKSENVPSPARAYGACGGLDRGKGESSCQGLVAGFGVEEVEEGFVLEKDKARGVLAVGGFEEF